MSVTLAWAGWTTFAAVLAVWLIVPRHAAMQCACIAAEAKSALIHGLLLLLCHWT